ncbi:hypothetical protein AT728_29310 [Streptomyces silvensis]|uniref:Uncharacterized protein n=1 Tax=Streptomyces silvensis TaxID=1765722 RepID=A0A0W7WVY6_9ACTN|nr:hypothetical protein AT728_29310 [Streptomyces silvensis]
MCVPCLNARTEIGQALYLCLRVHGEQVQMHAILPGLGLWHELEPQTRSSVRRLDENSGVILGAGDPQGAQACKFRIVVRCDGIAVQCR